MGVQTLITRRLTSRAHCLVTAEQLPRVEGELVTSRAGEVLREDRSRQRSEATLAEVWGCMRGDAYRANSFNSSASRAALGSLAGLAMMSRSAVAKSKRGSTRGETTEHVAMMLTPCGSRNAL
jgi:DNA-binding transcriptional LysR family regulator